MEDKYNILCTGLTKKDFSKQLRLIKKKKKVTPKRCYLCNRKEGDVGIGANLNAKDDENWVVTFPKIHLKRITREIHDTGFTFEFEICLECAALLDKFKKEDFDSDFSSLFKPRPRF